MNVLQLKLGEELLYAEREMALDAVVFPQELFGHSFKEWCATGEGTWSNDLGGLLEDGERVAVGCEMAGDVDGNWNVNSSSPPPKAEWESTEMAGRRKRRRRKKSIKNKEEVESQRMTHIAVERNRRRQMNEYLAVLRSLMPSSYVQRGDQASIVAGAINRVKELEQLLQSLQVEKRLRQQTDVAGVTSTFVDFFSFPQYSSYLYNGSSGSNSNSDNVFCNTDEIENQAAAANIEVTMVENHANLKVLSRRRPKQLLKLVMGLQGLRLVPLHLTLTSVDQMVMYSFSLKVEDDCQYTSVHEIATAVNQMLGRIGEKAKL